MHIPGDADVEHVYIEMNRPSRETFGRSFTHVAWIFHVYSTDYDWHHDLDSRCHKMSIKLCIATTDIYLSVALPNQLSVSMANSRPQTRKTTPPKGIK